MRYSLANRRNDSSLRGTFEQSLNSLNRKNRIDVFDVNLASVSSFRASLTRISAKANVKLELINQGVIVAASRPVGKKATVISVDQLDAGRYKLRATLKSGLNNKYRLSFSSTPLMGNVLGAEPLFEPKPQQDLGGNSPTTATNWGKIDAVTTISDSVGKDSVGKDSVGNGDTIDWYAFTVGERGTSSSRLNLGLTGDAGIYAQLYSKADLSSPLGSVVANKGSNNPLSHTDIALGAGDYFVKVAPVNTENKVNYSLNLSATGIADTAGNTTDTARVINNLQPLQPGEALSFMDFVGHGDIVDYYTFRTDVKTNLTINFERLDSGDPSKARIHYQLDRVDRNPAPKPYWKTSDGISLNSSIDVLVNPSYTSSGELTPGTYVLQLKSYFYNGDNSYRMTFSTSKQ